MGIDDKLREGDLFNRWADDFANTLQTFISKSPLNSDGAKTGGTGFASHVNGTLRKEGTILGGTRVVYGTLPASFCGANFGTNGTGSGTYHFSPVSGWIYSIHSLNFNVVDPAGDSGTLGSMTLQNVRVDGVNLGTLGAIDNCKVIHGEDIALHGSLSFEYIIKLSGTSSLGTEGTWAINTEVTGYKFRSMDDVT